MSSIKAGITVSLTGPFRSLGRQALAGLQAWAEDANRHGGLTVGSRILPVEVVCHDDGGAASRAFGAAHRLLSEARVDLLFGPYSTILTGAVAQVADEHGQVLWNQGGAHVSHMPGRRVVSTLTVAREYLSGLPGLLKLVDPTAGSFGIVRCSAGAFPLHVSAGLKEAAQSLGFNQVFDLKFPPDQTDFSGLAEQTAQENPDLLLSVGRIEHDLAMAKALAFRWQSSGRPRATAVVATPISRFLEELGDAVEGFIGPSQWEPPENEETGGLPDSWFGPTGAEVMASLRRVSAGSLPVDYPMVQAYAAGLVAQRCLREAGSLDPQVLWETAGSLDFHTFFGRFKIDPESGRQVGRSVQLVQWQQGRKVVIWPPELQQGEILLY